MPKTRLQIIITQIVILSEAKDLLFAAKCRSLAALETTKS